MNYGKFAIYNTTYGYFKICYIEDKITYIKFANPEDKSSLECPCKLTDMAYLQLMEYFNGERIEFTLPILMLGTDFQKKVWTALRDIPYGQTRSYKDIATSIGNPKASRAVGMANHNNPITIVIPCHRVIGANGKLTGYAGGLNLKSQLLKLESLRTKKIEVVK